jgi:hypothetical protein
VPGAQIRPYREAVAREDDVVAGHRE